MVPIDAKLIEATLSIGESDDGSLQQQFHGRIRRAILDGALLAGTRLPSSRVLAQQQNVSRNTVLAAYDQLIAEGYLESRRGAGTFVATALPDAFIATGTATRSQPVSFPPTHQPIIDTPKLPIGLPAIDVFPKDVWARLNSSAWRHLDSDLLLHNDSKGYLPLRQAIASYLISSRSVHMNAEQVLITSGLQQGLSLLLRSLAGNIERVILEDPGYAGVLRTAKACNANISYTPVDEFGACVPPANLQNSLAIICPSHQFPLGLTIPTARRMELLEWAQASNSYILEDDYDSEFRYAGRPLNSLQGMSQGDHVIYAGSFSKVTFPALRLGYLVLPSPLVETVMQYREAVDSFPSIVPQLALEKFINEGHFARHIRKLRKVHAARQQSYIEHFQSNLSQYFDLIAAPAGLDLVAYPTKRLAKAAHLKDTDWAKFARGAGLSARPLSTCYRVAKPRPGLMVGFANFPEEQAAHATRKLAQIMLSETGF